MAVTGSTGSTISALLTSASASAATNSAARHDGPPGPRRHRLAARRQQHRVEARDVVRLATGRHEHDHQQHRRERERPPRRERRGPGPAATSPRPHRHEQRAHQHHQERQERYHGWLLPSRPPRSTRRRELREPVRGLPHQVRRPQRERDRPAQPRPARPERRPGPTASTPTSSAASRNAGSLVLQPDARHRADGEPHRPAVAQRPHDQPGQEGPDQHVDRGRRQQVRGGQQERRHRR